MPFLVARLLEDHVTLCCIKANQTIREALHLMIQHDYSQLPVIDDAGELAGLVSSEEISRRLYHARDPISWLDLTVDHCWVTAVSFGSDQDIFEALNRLKDIYAIVIVDNGRPTGILTNYDLAHFFDDLTGDMLIVEDIETSLRELVMSVHTTEEALNVALAEEFGQERDQPGVPKKKWDDLSFGNLMYLIKGRTTWPRLEPILRPLELFWGYMDQVRELRNQLMHFRGRLDPVQHDLLITARNWLQARPRTRTKLTKLQPQDVTAMQRKAKGEGRYAPLGEYLQKMRAQGMGTLTIEFRDIESLLAESLPASAREHRAWWSNFYGNTQAKAWLENGWLVSEVDQALEQVSFRLSKAALYPSFFAELLARLKMTRPGITNVSKVSLQNWVSLSLGRTGFSVLWVLPREPVFRVELYIDCGDRKLNKAYFDALNAQRGLIETEIGTHLSWQRLDENQASAISASYQFDISNPNHDRQQAIEWGVQTMIAFIESFSLRIVHL
jgi:CBS domain-containing protein